MSDEYIVSRYDDGGKLVCSVHVPAEEGREKLEAWRRIYGAWRVKGFIEDNVPIPSEIYPCPLCGEEPKIKTQTLMPWSAVTTVMVVCPNCGLKLESDVNVHNDYKSAEGEKERLWALWNRRNGKVLPAVIEKIIHIDRDW